MWIISLQKKQVSLFKIINNFKIAAAEYSTKSRALLNARPARLHGSGIHEASPAGRLSLTAPDRIGSILFYTLTAFILWHINGEIQQQTRYSFTLWVFVKHLPRFRPCSGVRYTSINKTKPLKYSIKCQVMMWGTKKNKEWHSGWVFKRKCYWSKDSHGMKKWAMHMAMGRGGTRADRMLCMSEEW